MRGLLGHCKEVRTREWLERLLLLLVVVVVVGEGEEEEEIDWRQV